MLSIRAYQPEDEAQVVALWDRTGLLRPWNDPRRDIRRKLHVQRDGFLVGLLGNTLVATVMAGYDGHRGWINYLAVDPQHQRKGFGRLMMSTAEQTLQNAGCPKINLQVRTGNDAALAFYERIGFGRDEVVCLGKRIVTDASDNA